MKNTDLFFKEGNSDKEYHIQLEKSGGGYVVQFQYGRVGGALQAGTKTPIPVSLEEAEKIFNKLEKEKRAKGYADSDVKKNDFSHVSIADKKEVHILPQLLNPIEDVEQYINDDDYLAQEKKDGERRIAITTNNNTIGLNKKGTQVQLPTTIIESIICGDCILDGEIIGDKLFVFDIISNEETKLMPCMARLMLLNVITFGSHIEVVKTAYTTDEKRVMFDLLKSENKEGIVFKKKNAPYAHGRPASGGSALKFKFQKSATFIVADKTSGKRSVGLHLMDGDKKVFLGKCTIPPNHDIPEVGDLVEVQYLYAFKNGAIFQPVYLGKRNDSDLTDATISQLVYKENT